MAEQRVQRRLAAILAANVVGYSRLMREDEAGTLVRLKALRSELLHPKGSEYGGRIKTTGDGTLIEFPSAVDAVNHAIDVQQAIAHPAFRTQSTTGKDENARAVMKAFLDKKSWSTLSNYRGPCLYKRNEDLDRYLNLLRKAGMPE